MAAPQVLVTVSHRMSVMFARILTSFGVGGAGMLTLSFTDPVEFAVAPFASGVGIYAFYALQPYLLELYGDKTAYSIAGLAAAILSLSQVAGGMLAHRIRGLFAKRTTTVIGASLLSVVALVVLGLNSLFWLAVVFLVVWGFVFAVAGPVRQAYINDMIPSITHLIERGLNLAVPTPELPEPETDVPEPKSLPPGPQPDDDEPPPQGQLF